MFRPIHSSFPKGTARHPENRETASDAMEYIISPSTRCSVANETMHSDESPVCNVCAAPHSRDIEKNRGSSASKSPVHKPNDDSESEVYEHSGQPGTESALCRNSCLSDGVGKNQKSDVTESKIPETINSFSPSGIDRNRENEGTELKSPDQISSLLADIGRSQVFGRTGLEKSDEISFPPTDMPRIRVNDITLIECPNKICSSLPNDSDRSWENGRTKLERADQIYSSQTDIQRIRKNDIPELVCPNKIYSLANSDKNWNNCRTELERPDQVGTLLADIDRNLENDRTWLEGRDDIRSSTIDNDTTPFERTEEINSSLTDIDRNRVNRTKIERPGQINSSPTNVFIISDHSKTEVKSPNKVHSSLLADNYRNWENGTAESDRPDQFGYVLADINSNLENDRTQLERSDHISSSTTDNKKNHEIIELAQSDHSNPFYESIEGYLKNFIPESVMYHRTCNSLSINKDFDYPSSNNGSDFASTDLENYFPESDDESRFDESIHNSAEEKKLAYLRVNKVKVADGPSAELRNLVSVDPNRASCILNLYAELDEFVQFSSQTPVSHPQEKTEVQDITNLEVASETCCLDSSCWKCFQGMPLLLLLLSILAMCLWTIAALSSDKICTPKILCGIQWW